jgi:glycosyltransferase involved in cell wall biosynthesis
MNYTEKKLAIYHPWIYLKGGAERLILDIVTGSDFKWTIFTNHFDPENTFHEFENLDVVELSRVSVRRDYSKVMNAALKVITSRVDLKEYGLLVIISEGLGDYFVFRNRNTPLICICLTPLKIIHDKYTRQRYLEENRGVLLKFLVFSAIFRFFDRIAWKRYRKIMCISKEVKRRVLEAKLASPDKLDINYPGVKTGRKYETPEYQDFFLLPGRIMWQKNIELGIESFKKFCSEYPEKDFKLVIAGMVDNKSVTYYRKLKELSGCNNRIEFIKNPSDKQLFDLYRVCYCVLFTSLNEDWGIVPLEAMSFSKPVISVNRGGPKESIKDKITGFLVEPKPRDMVRKMIILADNIELTKKMGMASFSHVKRFSSSRFHSKLHSIINSVLYEK